MPTLDLLATIATSGMVAGLVTFAFQTYLKARIEQKYRLEVEQLKREHETRMATLKHELEIRKACEIEIANRRHSAYPRIAELVYRLKRIAEDLRHGVAEGKLSLLEEFSALAKEMEATLDTHLIDLTRDRLFLDIHKFKNLAINIGYMVSQVKSLAEHQEPRHAAKMLSEIENLCQQVTDRHSGLIEALSKAENTSGTA